MYCAYRCKWTEKEPGHLEADDGYSYSFQKEDLENWIKIRSSVNYSDRVRYKASNIEIVRIDIELFMLICKHRLYSVEAYEGIKDMGLMSDYRQGLRKAYGITPRV